MKFPKISIVIVTLNNERTIEKCVRSIVAQDYPKELIEYLNVDGGSHDMTKNILYKYKFTLIDSPIKKDAEAQRAIGLQKASNNLIVSIDADNYLPTKNWLRQMIQPFIDDGKVVHANTMHYAYRKNDSFYNRYCSLFGVTDPIVYYVGRPDRLPRNKKKWTLGKIIKETDKYYIVEFTKNTLPTVGCNGVVYRKDILQKYANSGPSGFLHIDIFVDVIEKGYNRFAIIKNDVNHDTAITLSFLMKKRIAFLKNYYLKKNIQRRYLIYNPQKVIDNMKLLLFVFYTVTFVKPVFDSIKGYISIRDKAWFGHPIICWIYLYSYGFATIRKYIKI